MSVESWINWQFHKAPGLIDPRASFARGSVGRTTNRIGLLATKPANAARFRFNPSTGLSEGLLVEPQRTNLLLRSEELSNAAWTAASLTVTANSTTAPDGTTTADTLAATGAGGNLSQAITIAAGRGIAFSKYLKANASSFGLLTLSDGTNSVTAWFNLASGAVGTASAGGTSGGTALQYSQHWIEPAGNGWYRCSLEVTSSVATTIGCAVSPAASNGAAAANTDSIYAWGAQAEAEATYTNATSYIPTTSATVTRSADNLTLSVSSATFRGDAGTMVFEWLQRPIPVATGGSSIVIGGAGNSSGFTDYVYLSRTGASSLGLAYTVASTPVGVMNRTCAFTPGVIYRAGFSWQTGRLAYCIDGGAIVASTTNVVPHTNIARIGVGMSPWSSSSTSVVSNVIHRAFIYAPMNVSDATLQALTAG